MVVKKKLDVFMATKNDKILLISREHFIDLRLVIK
jgi:hypothetical protein